MRWQQGGRLILPGHPMIRISSQAVEAVCLIGASAEAVWELLKEQVQPEMRVEALYCLWGPHVKLLT